MVETETEAVNEDDKRRKQRLRSVGDVRIKQKGELSLRDRCEQGDWKKIRTEHGKKLKQNTRPKAKIDRIEQHVRNIEGKEEETVPVPTRYRV